MRRFTSWNQPRVVCLCCGKRTTDDAGSGTELCRVCYDSSGVENGHTDTNGNPEGHDVEHCPICAGVACLHKLAPKRR